MHYGKRTRELLTRAEDGDLAAMRELVGPGVLAPADRDRWRGRLAVAERERAPGEVLPQVTEGARVSDLGAYRVDFDFSHRRFRMPDRVQRLWLYERGCVVHQEPEHTLEAFRWSSLHVRRRSVLRSDGGWATSWCRIAHDGGSVVEFASQSTMFPEVEVLTERLVAHITAARWPAAHAAFDAGQRLDFGAVALDRDHLHGPAGALPWREIEKLVVEEGQVRVKAAGRRRWWLNVSTAEVDDLENVLRLAPRT